MHKLIFGIILLLVPFFCIVKFQDIKKGFFYICSILIFFHLLVGIVTQAEGVFTYPVVFGIHLVFAVLVLIACNFIKKGIRLQLIPARAEEKKSIFNFFSTIDWVMICMSIIAFLHLFQVHFNYSGLYSVVSTPLYQKASSMVCPYPYYIDEWQAVFQIKKVFEHQSLPFMLWQGVYFVNLQFVFHSFISELTMLLGGDPARIYVYFSLCAGLMVCLLVYLYLRTVSISKGSAACASLSLLYITNGASLPGIWYFLPIIMGLVCFILSLVACEYKENVLFVLMNILTLLFYPPLFPFVVLLDGFYMWRIERKKRLLVLMSMGASIVVAVVIVSCGYIYSGGNMHYFFSYIIKKLFYETFTKNAIPQLYIWHVIPIPIMIVAICGLKKVWHERPWLIVIVALGLMYWYVYTFCLYRFIIEYARVVVFTALCMVIVSAFGFEIMLKEVGKKTYRMKYYIELFWPYMVLVFFLFLSQTYTEGDLWRKLVLKDVTTGHIYYPAAPANRYITEDDIRFFHDKAGAHVLSLPWKGMLCAVTDIFPLCTKAGTAGVLPHLYDEFINADNRKKIVMARAMSIDYVYGWPFECPFFECIEKSPEGLYLYKYIGETENNAIY